MAYQTELECLECGKTFITAISAGFQAPNFCPECTEKKNEKLEQKYLDELSKLTLEERVEQLEKRVRLLERRKTSPIFPL